ncbi:MAG: Hsp33 family molecular chaperone HslO [Bdellovibrionales bacterium]|nr:Hsp33 family molecular chaperone HslO [Oligoflexia bacterium]
MSIEYQSETDKWVKCISTSGTIRAVAIRATDTANFIAERHGLSEIGMIAFAEALIASLILSSYCKSGEKVNLNIQGSGWCHQAIIDANADAEVRGYILERPQDEIRLARNVGPWGIGLLSVLRTKHEQTQPYIGTVPLLTGRLAKDLTFYWLQSEQVQSAVGIEVFMENGKIKLADGFLIQAMPGATDEDIATIESHLKKLHQYDPDASQRSSPVNLLSYLLEDQSFSLLEEKPITFKCPCTLDRVKRSLSLVGIDELNQMVDENKDFEVKCDFCSENYVLNPEILQSILSGLQ